MNAFAGPVRVLGALVFASLLLGAVTDGACDETVVRSPDGGLAVEFTLKEGAPRYAVAFGGAPVIVPSALGFVLKDAPPLTGPFEIRDTHTSSFDETWAPVWGQRSEIRNRYNELCVELREKDKPRRAMTLYFRAYDDGVAFRYEIPKQKHVSDVEILSEETQFALAGDYTAWWIPADYDSYEHTYKRTPVSEIEAVNTPLTMKTNKGLHISIHEANLTDYAGMTLRRVPAPGPVLACDLVPWPGGVKVKGTAPLRTPWRTIQIAERAGGLVESSLILNLNEPNVIADTSWIRPMKYVGIWWEMHIKKTTWFAGPRHGATTENAKRHIDFAARHGIGGVLIEGWNTGWEHWGAKGAYDFVTPYPDFDLEEVARYAREKGVSLIGHHETGGDVPTYEAMIDSAFALYRRLGIRAVKTGYAGGIFPRGQHHHGQWMVRHYRMVVEKAAEYGIMLDVHEPIKPTGISRTYPNMMTREGVRGMEYNAWSPGNPPEHTTILPFTRMLAGPADYTPGIFDITFEQYQEQYRVYTTIAKQLALYVVLYSPLQMAADLPENYEGNPAFSFIEEVPVDWDETIVLGGEIGDYITVARRSGERWYIGSITDENPRVLEAALSFLDEGRRYRATFYADSPYSNWETTPTLIDITDYIVDANTTLQLRLAPGGGQAISIKPEAGS
jgi:alpha-glucosidase